MTTSARPSPIPRSFLVLAAGAVALSIGTASWFRLTGQTLREPDPPVAAERMLRVEDLPDGRVLLSDARTGRQVEVIEGEAGFARGILRSLARERRRTGTDPVHPFRLQLHTDGRLTLSDPATGQRIALESFGPNNAAVFARLITTPGATR